MDHKQALKEVIMEMYVIRERLHSLCPCDEIHVPLDKTIKALEEDWWGRHSGGQPRAPIFPKAEWWPACWGEVEDRHVPAFKSNSASGTFHNDGAEILKAVNAQNNRRCQSSRRDRYPAANDDQLEARPAPGTDVKN
jgi:hypothetical protein